MGLSCAVSSSIAKRQWINCRKLVEQKSFKSKKKSFKSKKTVLNLQFSLVANKFNIGLFMEEQ